MNKHLKSLLADYLKQVLRKSFSASEILDTYEIAVIYAYSEDRYEALNERLRKNLGVIDTDFGAEFVRILNKLPNFEGVVFRGTSISRKMLTFYKEALINDTIIPKYAFTSASKLESKAKEFMRTSKGDHQVLFSIISKQGKSIEQYSRHESEREILFGANTQFEILDIDDTTNDFITITLNEVVKNGRA
jgi:NAD:arginine ADP-ribosyltransferase